MLVTTKLEWKINWDAPLVRERITDGLPMPIPYDAWYPAFDPSVFIDEGFMIERISAEMISGQLFLYAPPPGSEIVFRPYTLVRARIIFSQIIAIPIRPAGDISIQMRMMNQSSMHYAINIPFELLGLWPDPVELSVVDSGANSSPHTYTYTCYACGIVVLSRAPPDAEFPRCLRCIEQGVRPPRPTS